MPNNSDPPKAPTTPPVKTEPCRHPLSARQELPVFGQDPLPIVCTACGEQLSGEPIA